MKTKHNLMTVLYFWLRTHQITTILKPFMFILSEYSTYFEMTFTDNVISISTANTLPLEVLNHKFISLELTAGGQRTVSVTTVIVLDIIQTNIVVPPVFSEAFYRGVYSEGSGLQFEGEITLSEGYDDTVAFELEGGTFLSIIIFTLIIYLHSIF